MRCKMRLNGNWFYCSMRIEALDEMKMQRIDMFQLLIELLLIQLDVGKKIIFLLSFSLLQIINIPIPKRFNYIVPTIINIIINYF